MKSAKELNDDILNITMTIRDKFPELSKYISEMPETIPNVSDPEMNIKTLNNYYESLEDLLKKYETNHAVSP